MSMRNNMNDFNLIRPLVPNNKMAGQQQQPPQVTTRARGLRYCQLPATATTNSSGPAPVSDTGGGSSQSSLNSVNGGGGSSSVSSSCYTSSPVPAPSTQIIATSQQQQQQQQQIIGGGSVSLSMASLASAAAQQIATLQQQAASSTASSVMPPNNNLQLEPSLAFTSLATTGQLLGGVNNNAASMLPNAVQALLPGGSVPEFLYQLTKMLTDTRNKSIIEWSTLHCHHNHNTEGGGGGGGGGRIEVHHPSRLEKEVLGKYFRHTKYSSFQRQLNYFGFRKIAGKGKMSPCSYVNDAATSDIRSLLLMKRKNGKDSNNNKDGGNAAGIVGVGVGGVMTTNGLAALQGMGGGGIGATAAAQQGMTIGTRSSPRSSTAAGSSKKRRPNPGDNIQPATVQPMFATSTMSTKSASKSNSSLPMTQSTQNFNAMAANIAMNIANESLSGNGTSQLNLGGGQLQQQQQDNNKRAKLSTTNLQQQHQLQQQLQQQQAQPIAAVSTLANNGMGYTVAIGKGVRHQLNGYLRFSNNGLAALPTNVPSSSASTTTAATSNSVISNNSTATSSTTTTTSTESASSSYLTHPSSQAAVSAPAPLQFFEPSELGMSIENSLNQLKDNFARASGSTSSSIGTGSSTAATAATLSTANHTAAASSSSSSTSAANTNAVSSSSSSTTTASNTNNCQQPSSSSHITQESGEGSAQSGLTRRVTSTAYLGGMLSRDDSLINLAMLPTLDTTTNGNGAAASLFSSLGGAYLTTTDNSTCGHVSRNDSLVNLAASIQDPLIPGGSSVHSTSSGGGGGADNDEGGSGGEDDGGITW